MITVAWWFIYRRWRFKSWTSDAEHFADKAMILNNAYRVNLASCRDHRAIYKDMCKILK